MKKNKKKKTPKAAASAKPAYNKESFIFLLMAVVLLLERSGKGVILRFADESQTYTEYFSYFDSLPFGYGHFFPLITAMLSVVVALLLTGYILTKRKGLRNAAEALTYTTICTALTAMFSAIRFEGFTWISAAIPLVLAVMVGLMKRYKNEDQ